MAVPVKICGLTRNIDIDVAIEGGASFLGTIFYPRSKRCVMPEAWAELAEHIDGRAPKVGVFVNADDNWLAAVNDKAPLDYLQLHGKETPARVEAIRAAFPNAKIIKVFSVAEPQDVAAASAFEGIADMLMFDAKPPKDPNAIPGGNGLSFDWRILSDRQFGLPWLLAGGISASNLTAAVELTGAPMVDLSSSIEDAPGIKNHDRLKEILGLAKTLGTS